MGNFRAETINNILQKFEFEFAAKENWCLAKQLHRGLSKEAGSLEDAKHG